MRVFKTDGLIAADESIGMRITNKAKSCDIHLHEFIELVYILQGSAVETIDGETYNVKRGDMLFVNCGASHSFNADSNFCHAEIYFSPKLVESGVITPENAVAMLALVKFDGMRGQRSGGVVTFHGRELLDVEFIIDSMHREYKKGSKTSKGIIESYANILLSMMLRKASGEDDDLAEDIWQELKNYIDNNPEEHITLSSLSTKSFYNPSYLSRVFKQKFGLSPMEYLRRRRLERAADILTTSALSVEEVITKVGFTDKSSFYHAFFKTFGCTPAEYRDSEKNKK